MRYSRFTRALLLFALMASCLQIGRSQATIAPAMCTDDGNRIQQTITIPSTFVGPWYIQSYSPFILPDGVLFIDGVGDEFYLSGDNPTLDTLTVAPDGSFVFTFFRDPTLAFSPVTFTNGAEDITVNLDAFTAPSSGITGSLGAAQRILYV